MGYRGIERRIHKVFVTHNTEYHLREKECVAVRDRRSGDWVQDHIALCRRAAGAIAFFEEGGVSASARLPDVGEALCFDGLTLVTSPVLEVERPPKEVVERYDS
jgi:hypothetical protein